MDCRSTIRLGMWPAASRTRSSASKTRNVGQRQKAEMVKAPPKVSVVAAPWRSKAILRAFKAMYTTAEYEVTTNSSQSP